MKRAVGGKNDNITLMGGEKRQNILPNLFCIAAPKNGKMTKKLGAFVNIFGKLLNMAKIDITYPLVNLELLKRLS